ncbi:PGR5-like protein 1A, chloroplastic isoform X2 [Arabidopsis lyrata subsp. lyrata]|uniref:PGR5-like protein 1A, chloroplastic isoform X2 n=1 Tax=Arabidopsis lyrata subsp. lyrata TaxID=81972 RepID=UPI000A29A823|nr:PGR5-like protein 1A, chloroplastic isoform X2 [Arabidopsis lyrata subsp. lyrata]|eukprot:XP_020873621.1 PGR5-like protein 1A, chloroplastic isoform X2 [Arabidopsis lyrata subsp. lyrata]
MGSKMLFSLTSPRLFSAVSLKPTSSFSPSSSRTQWAQLTPAKSISLRRRVFLLPAKATTEQSGGGDNVDSNVLPYCSINKAEKKTIGEMEQEFLQAMQSFYYDGKAIMSNEEFDNLKDELMWEGSSVVMLSSDEQRFLEASMAYVSGKPILNDEEYDKLKLKLKIDGSEIVCEGPRCSLRSKKVYSDLAVDYFKMLLLNVPATVVALGLFFFLDDITGFEITYIMELSEPYSFIFTWFAAVPVIVYLALSITKLIIKDFLILKGPCPNCGTENTSFFGTILSISSGGKTNAVKCSNCGTAMVYDSGSRLITLPEGSQA